MLAFQNFEISLPASTSVVLNGRVSSNEIICLRGPSGCGKTTTLRTVAGLNHAISGELLLGDKSLTKLRPEDRRAGFLMQGPQLIPSMNVLDNLIFALEIKHPDWSAELRKQRALEWLRLTGLLEQAASSISTLSGGEAQRIALGRIFLSEPDFFLLDEPFTGMDPQARQFFRDLLKDQLKLRQRPTVMVSHDVSDTEDLGARVVEWPTLAGLRRNISF